MMIRKLKIIGINLFILFLVLEIAARLVIHSESLMYNLFNNTTSMWLTFWQNKNSSQEDLYSPIYSWDEQLGWTLRPNLDSFAVQDKVYYSTTNDGIRKASPVSLQKDSSIIRIAVIGDSYTEGAEVSNGETFSDYLEQYGEGNLEVLNFGVGGYGHDQCLIRLQKDVLKYEPDIVLLGFVNCDVERNVIGFRDFAKPMYTLVDGKLSLSNAPILPIDSYKHQWVFKSLALANLLKNNEYWPGWAYQENLSAAIILEMNTLCTSNDIKFQVVFIPTPNEINANYDILSFCQNACKENHIDFINTLPIFEEAKIKKLPLKKVGHWDALGNELIAEGIIKF